METLSIVYDEQCAVCRRARDWLLGQPTYVRLELIAAGSPAAMSRYGAVPWLGKELVAADDKGNVWVGPAAFIMALWATRRYRPWAYRMSGTRLAPMAERFFHSISKRRHRWGRFVEDSPDDCVWCEDR